MQWRKNILGLSPKGGCATFYWPDVVSEWNGHNFILQWKSLFRLSLSHTKEQKLMYPPCGTIGIAITFKSVNVFHQCSY